MPGASTFTLIPEYLTVGVPATITIAHTALTSGVNGSQSASYGTGLLAPGAYNLVLCAVLLAQAAPNVTSITGCGLTFERIAAQDITESGANRRIELWRAMSTSTSSGTLTINLSLAVLGGIAWAVSEFSGVDISGTNGAGAIAQYAVGTAGSDGTTLTVTLAEAFSAVENATYGCIGVNDDSDDAISAGTGFSAIHDRRLSGSRPAHLQTQWLNGNDTTVDWSWATASRPGGIAVEIVGAGGQAITDAATLSDAVAVAVGMLAAELISLEDAVALVTDKAVAEGVTLVDAAAVEIILGAAADETITLADAVAFAIAIERTGTLTLSDVARVVGTRPIDRQAAWAPRWLITLEST